MNKNFEIYNFIVQNIKQNIKNHLVSHLFWTVKAISAKILEESKAINVELRELKNYFSSGKNLLEKAKGLKSIKILRTVSLLSIIVTFSLLASLTCGGDDLVSTNPNAVSRNGDPSEVDKLPAPNMNLAVGDKAMTISWEPVEGAASYNVYRNSENIANTPDTSYTDTSLANGHTYTYQVAAVDTQGVEGDKSAEISGVPVPSPADVGIPQNVSTDAGDSMVTLSWEAPDSENTYFYKIYRDNVFLSDVVDSGTTAYTDAGLANGTTYSYQVSAVLVLVVGEGDCSECSRVEGNRSTSVSATPNYIVNDPPKSLSGTSADGEVTLNWAAPDSENTYFYKIYRNGSLIHTTMGGVITYTNTSLTNGTTYSYQVSANVGSVESPPTKEINLTPNIVITGAPTSLSVSIGDTQVILNWGPPDSDRTYAYKIYRAGTLIHTTMGGTTTYTDTGLTNGTRYSYTISAVSSNVEGPLSNAVTATPAEPRPPAPKNLSASTGDTQVTLNWDAPDSDRTYTYKVYRGTGSTAIDTVRVTTYTDTGLTNGTEYSYQVSALAGVDNEGPKTPAITARPLPPAPPAPKNLTGAPGTDKISLSWDAPDASYNYLYKIYRGNGTTLLNTTAPGVTTYTETGLNPGVVYSYKVSAVIDAGNCGVCKVEGPQTSESSFTTVLNVESAYQVRQTYNAIQYVDTRNATGRAISITGSGSNFSDSFTTNVPQGVQMPFGMTHIHPVTNVRPRNPNTYSRQQGSLDGTYYTSHGINNNRRDSHGSGSGRERWEYYFFERARLKAFALTAVSGTGCWGRVAKDFPFMLYPGDLSSKTMDVTQAKTGGGEGDGGNSVNRGLINSREIQPLQVKSENPTANTVGEPGYFKAIFNESRTENQDMVAEFTTSYRSGIAKFTIPTAVDTATLFFTTMSSMKRDPGSLRINTRSGRKIVEGRINNLGFCGDDWSNYIIYMVADVSVIPTNVNTAASRNISWNGNELPLLLNTSSQKTILIKYGLSYVSHDAAYNNLQKEIPGFQFADVKVAAQEAWNDLLGRIRINDSEPAGSAAQIALLDRKQVFYDALYRASLTPNLFSDLPFDSDTGSTANVDEAKKFYRGFNDDIYNLESHQDAQYQNYSGWDTYRAQSQLVSLLDRYISSDMAQSLVNNAKQSNCSKGSRNCEMGAFTQWGIANDDSNVMAGEPGAIIVANAFLLGAANFNVQDALKAMQRGREDILGSTAHTSINKGDSTTRYNPQKQGRPLLSNQQNINRASRWLEIAPAMFAKAVFTKFLARLKGSDGHYYSTTSSFGSHSDLVSRLRGFLTNNKRHYNTEATAFFTDYTTSHNNFKSIIGKNKSRTSEANLQEGTFGQYLWMLPTNLNSIVADHHQSINLWYNALSASRRRTLPSSSSTTTQRYIKTLTALDDHLRLDRLNGGRNVQYSWFGNEPTHFAPWAYNFLSEGDAATDAWRTQRVVRKLFHDMFNASIHNGMPGNDDLGALSAWGVWAGLGLYPGVPGLPVFVMANPVFKEIEIDKDPTDDSAGKIFIKSPGVDYTTDIGSNPRYQYVSSIELKHGSGAFTNHGKTYITFKDLYTPSNFSQDVVLRINVITEPNESNNGNDRKAAPTGAATNLEKVPSFSSEEDLDAILNQLLN